MTFIEDLSDEVMLCIFRNLTIKELIPLQLVNLRWRRIAQDHTFYSVIRITEEYSISHISFLLSQHKSAVRQLYITECEDIEPLMPLISDCCNLETLYIGLCNGNGNQIPETIRCCTRLHTIILMHTPSIKRLNDLFEALSTRPMKKINLRNMTDDIEANGLCLRNVQDLRLKSIGAHAQAVYKFCINNSSSLSILKLIVSDESWLTSEVDLNETLFSAIGCCRQLKTLCLGPQVTSSLDDKGFSYFSKLNSLSTFEIHNPIRVSTYSFKEFFLRPEATNLRKISLYKCPSVDSVVLQLIAKHCPNLEKFTLEKSKAAKSDEDVGDLVLFAQNCKQLRRLYLFGIHILVSEILHLMPQYLPHLVALKYSNSDMPMNFPAFLPTLRELMPDFEVCGLQWTYSLYVYCKKKSQSKTSCNNLVCGNTMKMPTPLCL